MTDSKSEQKAAEDPVYISKCCSGQVSKALLRFLVTTFIALSLLFFAMFKLSTNVSGEEKALYYSLLSTCIAIYLPAPNPHDAVAAPVLGERT